MAYGWISILSYADIRILSCSFDSIFPKLFWKFPLSQDTDCIVYIVPFSFISVFVCKFCTAKQPIICLNVIYYHIFCKISAIEMHCIVQLCFWIVLLWPCFLQWKFAIATSSALWQWNKCSVQLSYHSIKASETMWKMNFLFLIHNPIKCPNLPSFSV